jgi:peptide/nickel transport system substrate-binding protein
MINKKWFALVGLVVVVSMLLAACQPAPAATQAPAPASTQAPAAPASTQAPAPASTQASAPAATQPPAPATQAPAAPVAPADLADKLTVGLWTTFDNLDPNATTYTVVGGITMHVAETLLWEAEPGKFEPNLATEFTSNADATEYTFKLRQGVKFSDGTPFNAQAVKFTFDRIVDPATKSQTALSLIGPYKETVIVDDYDIVVKFSSPYAPFFDSIAQPQMGIVSPTAYAKAGAANWGITTLVGTGPYLLSSYVPNSEVVLERNDNYWGGARTEYKGLARIKTLDYKIIIEPASRFASLQTGETQFIEYVPEENFASLKGDPNFVTVQLVQPGSGQNLMMNVKNPPLDDLQVRLAIEQGIDKAGMIASVWSGYGTPGCSILTSSIFGFDPKSCNLYPYNVDKAKQILEADGWVDNGSGVREKNGKPLDLGIYFQSNNNLSVLEAQYFQADMAKIGIKITLNGLANAGYFDAVRSGKHHFQFWNETATDPDVVRILLYSKNAGGGTNRNNYVNPEMDQLIDKAAGTTDSAQRLQYYAQIQKMVEDQAIMVNFEDPALLYANSVKLNGVIYYSGGNYYNFYAATLSK